jgi:hypothetical protein
LGNVEFHKGGLSRRKDAGAKGMMAVCPYLQIEGGVCSDLAGAKLLKAGDAIENILFLYSLVAFYIDSSRRLETTFYSGSPILPIPR